MHFLDFRRDTCTFPTKEMLIAISNAKLENDGYGDNSTVNELEHISASLMVKRSRSFAFFRHYGQPGHPVGLWSLR